VVSFRAIRRLSFSLRDVIFNIKTNFLNPSPVKTSEKEKKGKENRNDNSRIIYSASGVFDKIVAFLRREDKAISFW